MIEKQLQIMDRDIKIIEAVRKEPCLYFDNFNVEERNRVWKQLSEKFEMKEQNLKIRWHLLVQRYQSDTSFKYAQQMDFVERKSKNKVRGGNWPEFEITEEDMLETRRNSDEYVFLDVVDLEETSSTEPRISVIKEECDDENNDLPNECHDYHSVSSSTTSTNNESNKRDENTKMTCNRSRFCESKQKIQKRPYKLHTNKQSGPGTPEPVQNMVDKNEEVASIKTTTDRSEDDIFGELVSAMLKRMDTDKKKMVKKEIMNMLLT